MSRVYYGVPSRFKWVGTPYPFKVGQLLKDSLGHSYPLTIYVPGQYRVMAGFRNLSPRNISPGKPKITWHDNLGQIGKIIAPIMITMAR